MLFLVINIMNKITKILFFTTLVFVLSGCSYKIVKETNKVIKDPTITAKNDIKIDATIVDVGRFYNGQNGLSLSIPSGNMSTCIWTYNAGSGRIPNSITTDARTATEKHTISVYGDEEDLKVTCVDDFGNNYIGVFPEPDYKNMPTNNQINQEDLKIDWENL